MANPILRQIGAALQETKGFTSLSEDKLKKVPTSEMSYIFTLRPVQPDFYSV